jgi:hypothetical protein
MIINQAFVSPTLAHFKERFLNRYGLKSYYSNSLPCIFFGCYKKHGDHIRIARHKGPAIVVYGGSDAWWLYKYRRHSLGKKALRLLNSKSDIHHIAISKFISYDLKRLGIKHTCLPVCPTEPGLANALPLGDSV